MNWIGIRVLNSNLFQFKLKPTLPYPWRTITRGFAGVFLMHKLILCDEKWYGKEIWRKGGSPTNLDSRVLVICFLIRFHPNPISIDPNKDELV